MLRDISLDPVNVSLIKVYKTLYSKLMLQIIWTEMESMTLMYESVILHVLFCGHEFLFILCARLILVRVSPTN